MSEDRRRTCRRCGTTGHYMDFLEPAEGQTVCMACIEPEFTALRERLEVAETLAEEWKARALLLASGIFAPNEKACDIASEILDEARDAEERLFYASEAVSDEE